MHRLFSLLFILLCTTNFATGQTTINNSEQEVIVEDSRVSFYKYATDELSIKDKYLIDYCYKYKINLERLEEFQKAGVNVLALLKSTDPSNYKKAALVAPIVVIGTVVGRNYDAREEAQFHTTLEVKVEKIINEGKWNSTELIKIKQSQGKVKDKFLNISSTPKLFIGEQVLLYLHPLSDLIESRRKLAEISPKYSTEQFNEYIKSKFGIPSDAAPNTFTIRSKFAVRREYVYNDFQRVGSLEEIISLTKKIIEINSN